MMMMTCEIRKMNSDDGRIHSHNDDDDDCYYDLYDDSVALRRWLPPQQQRWSSEELRENCCGGVYYLRKRMNDGNRSPEAHDRSCGPCSGETTDVHDCDRAHVHVCPCRSLPPSIIHVVFDVLLSLTKTSIENFFFSPLLRPGTRVVFRGQEEYEKMHKPSFCRSWI